MKAAVKAGLKRLGLYERASALWIRLEPRLVNSLRALTGKNQRLTAQYLAAHKSPSLHIACGNNELAGWLNTELCPRGPQIFLDATKPFPFDTGVFSFIYCEHMIEHISARDAEVMLRECFRVMSPGGVIRLVTPNMTFLTTLLDPSADPKLATYLRYNLTTYGIQAPVADGVAVFNHFMRAWGHQFIYNEASLRAVMALAGFEDIRDCSLNDSPHPELSGLAKLDRMPDGILEMESFVLEGRKPGQRA